MKKRIGFVLTVLIAFLVGLGFNPRISIAQNIGNFISFISVESSSNIPYQIAEKDMKSEDKYIKIDVKIPQIQALENKDLQEFINKDIYDSVNKNIEIYKKASKKSQETFANERLKPYEYNVSYELKPNDKKIISIIVKQYSYTGGAHGMTDYSIYNYDINTGKEVTLKSIFKDESYKEELNKLLRRQMEERTKEYIKEENIDDQNYQLFTFEGISDKQRFYIEGNDLVLFFGAYEIAPYSFGSSTFKIPMTSLEKYLK